MEVLVGTVAVLVLVFGEWLRTTEGKACGNMRISGSRAEKQRWGIHVGFDADIITRANGPLSGSSQC